MGKGCSWRIENWIGPNYREIMIKKISVVGPTKLGEVPLNRVPPAEPHPE